MPQIVFRRADASEPELPALLLSIERAGPAVIAYSVEEGGEVLARTLQQAPVTRRMRARLGQDAEVGPEFRDQPKRFLIQIGGFSLRIRAGNGGFVWELEEAGEIIGRVEQTREADREMRRRLGIDAPLTLEPAARTRRRRPTEEAEIALAQEIAARKS